MRQKRLVAFFVNTYQVICLKIDPMRAYNLITQLLMRSLRLDSSAATSSESC